MKFTTPIAALCAVAATVSAAPMAALNQPKGLFKIEPGAPNGWYTHHIALDGSVHTQYHGEVPSSIPTTSAADTKSKRAPFGAQCQSLTFQPADGQAAIQGLANTLDSNNQFYHAISYSSGTAVAYGCDYAHGQSISGADMTSYLTMLTEACGQGKEGYFSLPDWKASYGITTSGDGFC